MMLTLPKLCHLCAYFQLSMLVMSGHAFFCLNQMAPKLFYGGSEVVLVALCRLLLWTERNGTKVVQAVLLLCLLQSEPSDVKRPRLLCLELDDAKWTHLL